MYILFCYIWYNLYQFLLSSILFFHSLILYVICVLTPQIKRSSHLQVFTYLWIFNCDSQFLYLELLFVDLFTHPSHPIIVFI